MRRKVKHESSNNATYKQLHRTKSVRDKQEHSSKGASFIKVLGRDFFKQLQLPEDFTINVNGYVPHRFIIESATTKQCWRVEVEKDGDGRLYFRDGWADFVQAQSLEVGNFLLFEYEEQSIFQVRIYNRNGFERTLILESTKGSEHKPQNTIDDEDSEDIEALEFEPVILNQRDSETRRFAPTPRKYGKGIHKKRHAITRSPKRTIEVSETNKCFSITFHHTKKHQFKQMTIPKTISLKMKLKNKYKVKLQDVQGNSWNVKLCHRRDGRAIFGQGWREFLNDSEVSHLDKLQCKFVSEEVVQVEVTKFSKVEHESDETTSCFDADCKQDESSSTSSPKHTAVEIPKTSRRMLFCDSENSFSCIWRESSARKYLHIPMAIVRAQNLMKKKNIVLRDPEGMCWPLEVKKLTGNRVAFTNGWVDFWRGYNIANGDYLKFEFLSKNLIQVSTKKNNQPPLKPEGEGVIIGSDTMDTTEGTNVNEPKVDMSRKDIDASIEIGADMM